jgi:1,4-dihydroxy-2-naphthoate octaprenyltransferase
MHTFRLFLQASRFRVLPVMVLPVLAGAAGSYAWNHVFFPGWFLVTLVGAAAMHLFSNMINDLWDYRNGVDPIAGKENDAIATHSGLLASGAMRESQFAAWTWFLFAVALLCGLALAWYRGPWVLAYGGLGALLAYFYVAPPLRYGYRGKGYSELAIVLAFGVLPVLGSYYVQTLRFDIRAVLVSLPIGIMTTLILFHHHFLHWKADRQAGKNTLVVVLGEQRALEFSRRIVVLAIVSLIVGVLLQALPVYALLASLPMYLPWRVYRTLGPQNPPSAYLPLMSASITASVLCGLVIVLSLLAQGWLAHAPAGLPGLG